MEILEQIRQLLLTLFSLSHIDQYHQSEINETLAPYKERLEKLKECNLQKFGYKP